MTKTPAERQAEYRQRRIALGLKAMTLWLPPEALAVLERYPREQRDGIAAQALLAYNGNVTVSDSNDIRQSRRDILPVFHPALEALTRRVEALEGALTLHNSGVTKTELAPQITSGQERPELAPWDVSVQGHIEHEAQGAVTDTTLPPVTEITDTITVTNLPKHPARLPLEHVPDLIQKAKTLNAEGASWAEIARRWNAEGIPTLSGKGQWHRKTVSRMVGNE
jgi:hypothetical protein